MASIFRKALPAARSARALFPTQTQPEHVRNYKVCVVGAAGGIGQPLSLLMKMVRASGARPPHPRAPLRRALSA
jgi:5,10-methylene-tetrahydrofolate dehydrogenase/methenyl tetrahydrofolate cyclohydrolase